MIKAELLTDIQMLYARDEVTAASSDLCGGPLLEERPGWNGRRANRSPPQLRAS
jgi:hypothetical protein